MTDRKIEGSFKKNLNFAIFNVDKPSEMTSFDVVGAIRKQLKLHFPEMEIKKCGHLGTLDPNVTGVLPICINESCRIQRYLMGMDKTYTGIMKLHRSIKKEDLHREMEKFIGTINQLPPKRSRVKRELRKRKVYDWKILEFNEKKREVRFFCRVEAGTYIRKLISDLGELESINGAHMINLRRIQAGLFCEKDKEFIKLDELIELIKNKDILNLEKKIISGEIIKKILPCIKIKDDDSSILKRLSNGCPVYYSMIMKDKKTEEIMKKLNEGDKVCILNKNNLIEVANVLKYEEEQNTDIFAKPEVVFK